MGRTFFSKNSTAAAPSRGGRLPDAAGAAATRASERGARSRIPMSIDHPPFVQGQSDSPQTRGDGNPGIGLVLPSLRSRFVPVTGRSSVVVVDASAWDFAASIIDCANKTNSLNQLTQFC